MAFIGLGVVVALDDGTSSAYVTVPDVFSLQLPSPEVGDVEVTNLDSSNRSKEFIPGLCDPGDGSFKQRYSDANLDRLLDIHNDNTIHSLKVTYPEGLYIIIPFYSKKVEVGEVTPEGPMELTFTFKATAVGTTTPA